MPEPAPPTSHLDAPGADVPVPDVSIIVPTRGRSRELEAMLAGLVEQTVARDRFEVIVVDDGSEPPLDLSASPAALALGVRCLRQHAGGPATARNTALRHVRAPLILFLNSDVVLAPDGIERHLAAHAHGPARAVMGRFDFLPRHVTPFVALADALEVAPLHAFPPGAPLPFVYFWTGNLSVPTAVVRAVGGFDERFRRPVFEDMEIGYRLNQVGVPLYFDRDIHCAHDHAFTLDVWLERAERIGWEWVTFARRHGGRPCAILDGEDEPDDTLLAALHAGLLHQHDAQRFRIHELRELLAEADRRLASGEARATVDADLQARGRSLLAGINTLQRMRGILAHLLGYTIDDLARHRESLRPFAAVHSILRPADIEDTRRILDLLPSDSTLVVTHHDWLPADAFPRDPRLVVVRLSAGVASDVWKPILDATPCRSFVLLEGRPLPTASEIQGLVRFLEVSPRIGAVGLGQRAGNPHSVAAVAPRIPTHAMATQRKLMINDRPTTTTEGEPTSYLDRLAARGLVLAVFIPAGRPVS